jgi:hypothetical protein
MAMTGPRLTKGGSLASGPNKNTVIATYKNTKFSFWLRDKNSDLVFGWEITRLAA